MCNILIEGAAKLVKWENMMETGKGAEAEAQILELVGPQYPPLGLSGVERARRGAVTRCGVLWCAGRSSWALEREARWGFVGFGGMGGLRRG